MPGFIKPQLAMLKSKAPQGDQWLHEIKYDGYRVQVHVNRGRKKVYTRNGLDWTKRFPVMMKSRRLTDGSRRAGRDANRARQSQNIGASGSYKNQRASSSSFGRMGRNRRKQP